MERELVRLSALGISHIAAARDGQRIAVVTGGDDNPNAEYSRDIMRRSLWVMHANGDHQRLLSDQDAHSPAWSPTGAAIAYLCRASGTTQVWRSTLKGDAVMVTDCHEQTGNHFAFALVFWSPDASRILIALPTRMGIQDLDPASVPENPVIVEPSSASAPASPRLRIFSVPADGGSLTLLCDLPHQSGCFIGWRGEETLISCGSHVYAISADKSNPHVVREEEHCLAALSGDATLWLMQRDVEQFRIGRCPDDPSAACEWLYSVPFDGHREHPVMFLPDVGVLYLRRQEGLARRLMAVQATTGERHTLTGERQVVGTHYDRVHILQMPPDGPLWFPVSESRSPAEIHMHRVGEPVRRVSDLHPKVASIGLPEPRRIAWQSDGWEIEGLLVEPNTPRPAAGYPTLIYLHGGPSDHVDWSCECLSSGRSESAAYYMAMHGFAVLLPNVRGSDSYSREFMTQLSHYHIFDRPYADLMIGVDLLVHEGIADPQSLGLYGHSYGAMLTVWTIGHTTRFRGALGACGLYDEELRHRYANASLVEVNAACKEGVDQEALWRQPSLWTQISPIARAMQISTPLLLIQTSAESRGPNDARPLYNTLRNMHVETYLAGYPNAFHTGGWNAGYQQDYMRRTLAWFRHALLGDDLPEWFMQSPLECR